MFQINNVSKSFGDEYALRNVSMNIGKGLSFIVGASGSGKTTLLKILCGIEDDYQGEVLYCGENMAKLSNGQKSYIYNNVFGFVWQDFNLIEDMSVWDNVMLPQYLKAGVDEKSVLRLLRDLKISELSLQKVRELSGGQKQRVAIARELAKNPQIIIADEPTSALDEKSTKNTIEILRDIAKSRAVVIVTHDTSLIGSKDKVYELDKGELVNSSEVSLKASTVDFSKPHKLSIGNAFKVGAKFIKSKLSRTVTTVVSVVVAATLMLVSLSGGIIKGGDTAFEELVQKYGNSILDLGIVRSFMSASGTDGNDSDGPNANVEQDINGLYDKYKGDERIEFIVYSQAFDNIKVNYGGNEIAIKSSGNAPTMNKLVAGKMPMGERNEVTVPMSLGEKMGLKPEEMIGKEISFNGSIYNWDSGEAVSKDVSTKAVIVGVMDTTMFYEYQGEMTSYQLEDVFFFSNTALEAMRKQADMKNSGGNFTIRATSPEGLISLKDEFNANGIVPLGQFELVEDMVRLNQQTNAQSGSAVIVIGILAVVIVISVCLMTSVVRRREYAIFKVSGYKNGHLSAAIATEFLMVALVSVAIFLCLSPLFNIATKAFWGTNILNGQLLLVGCALTAAMTALGGVINGLVAVSANVQTALKTGDR